MLIQLDANFTIGWDNYTIVNIDRQILTLQDEYNWFREVTVAQLQRAEIKAQLSNKIYGVDGGVLGECYFWSNDENESREFESHLIDSGLSYEYEFDVNHAGTEKFGYWVK